MKFSVYVELTPQVDHVDANGHELPIEVNGAVRSILYENGFSSYGEAMSSTPVTFRFSMADQPIYVGVAKPGLCHSHCNVSNCPTDDTLVGELVQIPIGNFGESDFSCIICSDAQQMVDICPEAGALTDPLGTH